MEEEPSYRAKTLAPGARNALLNYTWPGNVRELEIPLIRAALGSPQVLGDRMDKLGIQALKPGA
jgi:transcriptional regulator with GAF, ATPase, and Fis domain